ncbi:MAG: cyclic nucleotide-binding domain-containing protein [Desulfomonile tiedjei]|nr:cyclic nucleotide-binding domain-containing protein [Desulfomonile tiedjei]
MRGFLEKYLKVYVHESSRFLWMTAIFFAIFLVTAVFRNYVDTAFLKRYGPQYIPQMLVINALLTFVIFGIADRLGRRFRDHHLLTGFLIFYAVSSAALFLMVRADISIAYPILYQLLYLLDAILLVYLWNIAGDLFDARQGKRIFPLITAGQVLGTTLGSFGTQPFTRTFGENAALLLFAAVCMAVAFFVARTAFRVVGATGPRGSAEKTAARTVRLIEVPGIMKTYPIVRYLVITGLIPNILLPIFLSQFSVIANHTFASEQSLISFLSIFRGLTTLTTFVLLFFMGRLYSTMGLTNASLVHPLNFTILFSGLAAYFNIFVACYGQFTAILIQRAVSGPVNKILFNIVPGELLVWSRTFIRGTVIKVGMLAGSLAMIFLKPVLDARLLSYLALVLAIYWVVETLFFRKHYKRILKQVIVEKQIDFDQIESVRTFDSGGAAMELGPVDVESRVEDQTPVETRVVPTLAPDVALKLLEDPNPATRAEAAVSLAAHKDVRAVRKLIALLADPDDDVRKSAMDALMTYRESILPFLELSLIEAPPRAKQGILEVIRVSGLKEFEMVPFLGKELAQAYSNLLAIQCLQPMKNAPSVQMLRTHLEELNDEILSLVFYALWVYHADMRLLYQALRSETASIAVELLETSVQKELGAYLIPLLEDVPLERKIEAGRRLFPLMRNETLERVLSLLAGAEDPVTRLLAAYVIGDQKPERSFVPILESRLEDESPFVQEVARSALKRAFNEVAEMPTPTIIEKINKLKEFSIFEGMGVREFHAIASVLNVEHFQAGDVLIREGEENASIYLMVRGKITVYEGFGTNLQKEKVTLGPGSFVGELSLFSRMPPNATCVAAEPVEVFVLRHHQFQEIMRVYPQIGINLCRFFTMKLRAVAY